ncbi:MAG TPA: hypothetical protein VMP01_10230 [Pirellulaceae bacterium]|nr:hypothetical protein [Pirellulaceae bacterium]
MKCFRWLFSLCAVAGVLASYGAADAAAQGCTAQRGCPTIPPSIPGGFSFNPYSVSAQQDPEQLDVAPDVVDGQYSVSDMYDQSGGPFLQPGQVIWSYQWNYSDADRIFLHNDHLPDMDAMVNLVSIQNEHVIGAEIGIAERLSFVYELPFQYNNRALDLDAMTGGRLTGRLIQKNGGMADSRMYLRYWTGCCEDHNLSVYAGVKVPTGVEDSGDFYQGEFLYDDISIQTGTGSWDPLLGFFAYRRTGYVTWFGSFNYRISPASTTNALALDPLLMDPNSTIRNSVTDQLSADVGFNFALGQWMLDERGCCNTLWNGLTATFAVVEAAVPSNDIINDSQGYRRAFNALFVRPGFIWNPRADTSIYGNFPVTVDRNLEVPGSFPDISFSFGWIQRW